MSARPTRVLVVDDSLTARKRLVEALSADPDLLVIGEAADATVGVEMTRCLRPDVITMDLVMPGPSGVAATEHIMGHCPTPILIVSASAGAREALSAEGALAAGAVDFLDKPGPDEPQDTWVDRLRAAVKMTARIRVITHLHTLASRRWEVPKAITPMSPTALIAIGGSTGAPSAVATLLRALPPDYPIPILLVIHAGSSFRVSLSDWLARQCALPVRPASYGEPIPRGGVLVAPPERHLVIERGRLWLSDEPERHGCRPSVDALFESIAHEIGPHALGCLLTGMGRDGAAGLLAMRNAGAVTIAQDEATSAIWGMPGEAAARGAAARVLSLDQIARALRTAPSRCASTLGPPR
jgi:two-component system, chemotaxis family, protein-glutamate methylesterase/glutaminase